MTETMLVIQIVVVCILLFVVGKLFSIGRSLKRTQAQAGVRLTQQLEALDRLYYRTGLPRGSLPPSRGWAASPDFLNILYEEIVRRRPKIVVECGSGLTTIIAARALQKIGGGRLLSLEHDDGFADLTLDNLCLLDLRELVDIRVAPLVPQVIGGVEYLWYEPSNFEIPDKIDFITVDGPPAPLAGAQGRYPVGPVLFGRLSRDGAVLFDDAGRPGEKGVVDKLLREFQILERKDISTEKGCSILTFRIN